MKCVERNEVMSCVRDEGLASQMVRTSIQEPLEMSEHLGGRNFDEDGRYKHQNFRRRNQNKLITTRKKRKQKKRGWEGEREHFEPSNKSPPSLELSTKL